MVELLRRRDLKKRLLEAIGNSSPEELGRLAMDLMENVDRIYGEAGVDDTTGMSETEENGSAYFQWSMESPSAEAYKQLYAEEYGRLKDEYKRRFAGIEVNNEDHTDVPIAQPKDDDIQIAIDPHTGVEETIRTDGESERVEENTIFGEDD